MLFRSGKSSLGLQFLHEGVQQEESCLFVSLDERLYKIFQMAEGFGYLRDFIKSEKFRVLAAPSADLNVNRLFWEIQDSVRELEIKRVVVDGLNVIEANTASPTELRNWIYSLVSTFEQQGITSILTHENFGGEDRGYELAGMAIDTILEMRLVEEQGVIKRQLSIPKMRTSAADMRVRQFEISNEGVRILPA